MSSHSPQLALKQGECGADAGWELQTALLTLNDW